MRVTHEPWLVALSIVVAIQGAYVGLSLAVQVAGAEGLRRRLLLAGAATSFAVAIWAMHFVGMLAARLPAPVDYLVFPTLLSFLVCVIVVGAAVFAASSGPLTPIRLTAAACGMGAGIVTMHYLGMTALHASVAMQHTPWLVAASMAVAILASGLALWLAGGHGGRPPLLLSATAFGTAISGMHYTAMAGLTLFPHTHPASGAPALSSDLLATPTRDALRTFNCSKRALKPITRQCFRLAYSYRKARRLSSYSVYSRTILADLANLETSSISRLISSVNSGPAKLPGSVPMAASFSRKLGSLSPSRVSTRILATISSGVPFGTNNAVQIDAWNPCNTPVSSTVGTLGSILLRAVDVTARSRTCPESTKGKTADNATKPTGTSPEVRAVAAGAPPR